MQTLLFSSSTSPASNLSSKLRQNSLRLPIDSTFDQQCRIYGAPSWPDFRGQRAAIRHHSRGPRSAYENLSPYLPAKSSAAQLRRTNGVPEFSKVQIYPPRRYRVFRTRNPHGGSRNLLAYRNCNGFKGRTFGLVLDLLRKYLAEGALNQMWCATEKEGIFGRFYFPVGVENAGRGLPRNEYLRKKSWDYRRRS